MRARFNPKAIEELNAFDRFIKQKEEIQKIITDNKDKKIFLEIGMGKGDFITQMATLDRENIYIGVEVSPPILALAVKKLKRYEEENGRLDNIYFMSFDAITIAEVFEEKQIEKGKNNIGSNIEDMTKNEKFLEKYDIMLEEEESSDEQNGNEDIKKPGEKFSQKLLTT